MSDGYCATARVLLAFAAVAALLLSFAGCSKEVTRPEAPIPPLSERIPRTDLAMNGLKLGLLADTRLQTTRSLGIDPATGKPVFNAEFPTPALANLAPDMLEYFLHELIEVQRVDLVLFLGNAANNGCQDELQAAFDILRRYRDGSYAPNARAVPIFFVIGNHDYLGAGYTPQTEERNIYCDDRDIGSSTEINRPVDKYELMAMVHEFNVGNFEGPAAAVMNGWSFSDNFDSERLKRACIVNDPLRYQHVKLGCYYSARLVHPDGSEILLADTSDYHHKIPESNFDIPVSEDKWYGLTGWISLHDGGGGCERLAARILPQAQWFACRQALQPPPVRLVAAHYPLQSLSPTGRTAARASGVLCGIAPLLAPPAAHGDYWLSADTHLRPYLVEQRKKCASAYPYDELVTSSLNIGSALDYDWSPTEGSNTGYEDTPDMSYAVEHEPQAMVAAVVLGPHGSGRLALHKVIVDVRECGPVIDELRAQPAVDAPVYTPVAGATDYKSLFGLDRSHLRPGWTAYDQINARKNLTQLIEHMTRKFAAEAAIPPLKIKACIALESARLAGGLQTRPFECPTCPPWRIMRRIEEEGAAYY